MYHISPEEYLAQYHAERQRKKIDPRRFSPKGKEAPPVRLPLPFSYEIRISLEKKSPSPAIGSFQIQTV